MSKKNQFEIDCISNLMEQVFPFQRFDAKTDELNALNKGVVEFMKVLGTYKKYLKELPSD